MICFRRTKAARITQLEEQVSRLIEQMKGRALIKDTDQLRMEVRFPTEEAARKEGHRLLEQALLAVTRYNFFPTKTPYWKRFQALSDYMKRKGWEVPSVKPPEPTPMHTLSSASPSLRVASRPRTSRPTRVSAWTSATVS